MERAVILIANTATRQAVQPGLAGFGADLDISARIDRMERQILAGVMNTPHGMRRLASTYTQGRASALIDLIYSAIVAYVSYPGIQVKHGGHLAGDTLDAIDAALYRPVPAQAVNASLDNAVAAAPTVAAVTTGDGSNPIPAASHALAQDLVQRAKAYLTRNPSLATRAGADFALLVPADPACMAKIRGHLASGDDAAEEYIRSALLARHPNAACDKSGHMLALSGTVFHIADSAANGTANPEQHDVRLTQMIRQDEASPHDDVWDAESRVGNAGLLAHTNRRPMLCLAGAPVKVSCGARSGTAASPAPSLTLRPLHYRPGTL